MPVYVYVIIGAAAGAVIGLIVSLLKKSGKGKKSERDLLLESRQLIGDNAQSVEVLLGLASGKEGMTKELKDLEEKLKYLSPSADERVKALDMKIKDALGDIKIELTKSKGSEDCGKADKFMQEIQVHIAERSVFTSR